MNEIPPLTVSAGLLAMITLELIKVAVKKWYIKDQAYDFPPYFYNLIVPFLTALWGIGLSYAGMGEPLAYTWQTLLQWAIAILVSLGSYYLGVKPLKTYAKEYKYKKL